MEAAAGGGEAAQKKRSKGSRAGGVSVGGWVGCLGGK